MKIIFYCVLLALCLGLPLEVSSAVYAYKTPKSSLIQKKKQSKSKSFWKQLFKKSNPSKRLKKQRNRWNFKFFKKSKVGTKKKSQKSKWGGNALWLGFLSMLSFYIGFGILLAGYIPGTGALLALLGLGIAIWVLVKRKKLKKRYGTESIAGGAWKWGNIFAVSTVVGMTLLLFYMLFMIVFVGF